MFFQPRVYLRNVLHFSSNSALGYYDNNLTQIHETEPLFNPHCSTFFTTKRTQIGDSRLPSLFVSLLMAKGNLVVARKWMTEMSQDTM